MLGPKKEILMSKDKAEAEVIAAVLAGETAEYRELVSAHQSMVFAMKRRFPQIKPLSRN